MADPKIQSQVKNTLQETGKLLVEKHRFNPEEHQKYIDTIIRRFVNPHISDDVTRVGRSPLRKLGPQDRLVSPATQYITYLKEQPVSLAKGIAAALRYDYQEDPEAVQIQESIRQKGLENTINEITQIPTESELMKRIVGEYHHFAL
jgi:mannitol-1-phosphate 5-dehydrogenase